MYYPAINNSGAFEVFDPDRLHILAAMLSLAYPRLGALSQRSRVILLSTPVEIL